MDLVDMTMTMQLSTKADRKSERPMDAEPTQLQQIVFALDPGESGDLQVSVITTFEGF